jgi:cytochrome oxidase assembly protein ShyY1
MTGWRFVFSRRWLGYVAVAVVFALACVALANWQLARREEARAAIERVERNWDAAPTSIDVVLGPQNAWDEEATWTPVALSGEYLIDEQLLVRGRPNSGRPGFEVLVPFELADGRIVIVDRGWVPAGNEQDAPDAVPAAPSGPVEVVVRLKGGEPVIAGRSAPEGQVATIHLPAIADLVGGEVVTGAYGLLESEDPAPATRPIAYDRPVADEGPHLSYAFQWFVFALMGLVGLGWAIRQEYRHRNEDDPAEQARAAKRASRAAAKAPSDAEIEDALLDR